MSDQQFERAVNDWLEDGSDRTPRSAIDGVLLAVKTTPQERDLGIPWRFSLMPALTRGTSFAAIALVAVVGVGALLYFNLPGSGGPGSQATPTPTATATATATTVTTPTPQPTFDPGSPTAWTTYTSAVYGFTMAYPSDWSVRSPATHKWQPNEPVPAEWSYVDVFANPKKVDGDSIVFWVWQMPAPTGSDVSSWEGLEALVLDICDAPALGCPSVAPATLMCLGQQECRAAIIVLLGDEQTPGAFFGDPETGVVTVFTVGRPDDFPAAARYGGTVALLKAILAQVDVREPLPGETPH